MLHTKTSLIQLPIFICLLADVFRFISHYRIGEYRRRVNHGGIYRRLFICLVTRYFIQVHIGTRCLCRTEIPDIASITAYSEIISFIHSVFLLPVCTFAGGGKVFLVFQVLICDVQSIPGWSVILKIRERRFHRKSVIADLKTSIIFLPCKQSVTCHPQPFKQFLVIRIE